MEEKKRKIRQIREKKTNYGREKRNISQIREKMTYYGREIRKIRQIQEKKPNYGRTKININQRKNNYCGREEGLIIQIQIREKGEGEKTSSGYIRRES